MYTGAGAYILRLVVYISNMGAYIPRMGSYHQNSGTYLILLAHIFQIRVHI